MLHVLTCARLRKSKMENNAKKRKSDFSFSNQLSLEEIRDKQASFAAARGWGEYALPRNLLLGMVGEVGKLSEIFQWKGEVEPGLQGWSEEERDRLGQELSDTLLYLVRLAERCHIDLPSEMTRKFELNEAKFPIETAKSSSSD